MPEQIQNPEAGRKPAIRTMKSDAEELLKSGKPSLAQMIARSPEPFLMNPRGAKLVGGRGAVLATSALVILGAIGGGLVYLSRTPSSGEKTPQQEAPDRTLQRLSPLQAYFATETSRTISVKKQDRPEFLRLMRDAWQEKEREGTVKRLAIRIEDGPYQRFATPDDFFQMWRITLPPPLAQRLDPNLMVFIHSGSSGNRLGLAVRSGEPDRTFADMLGWESSILASITPLFFDERPENITEKFEDRTWRNIDWRYLKLSGEKDLGVGYALFPAGNVFLFTTSKETMETAINRLFAK
jgi:hypothetical protein